MALLLINFGERHNLRIVKRLERPPHSHSQQIPPHFTSHTRSATGSISVQIRTRVVRSDR